MESFLQEDSRKTATEPMKALPVERQTFQMLGSL